MSEKTLELKQEFLAALENANSMEELENIRIAYLGKKGSVTELMKEMKNLSNEEKTTFGQKVNELKNEVSDKITEKAEILKAQELEKEYIVSFQTEIEAFDDLNIGEQLITLEKTRRKCKITYMDDGLKEILYDCTVKRMQNSKEYQFEGVNEDGKKVLIEYNRGMDLRMEIY